MHEEVGRSFLCSRSCTLSAIPISNMKESYSDKNVDNFKLKTKVVIPKSVSDSLTRNLSRKDTIDPILMKSTICRSDSVSLIQHVSKFRKCGAKIGTNKSVAIHESSIDLRVWGPK